MKYFYCYLHALLLMLCTGLAPSLQAAENTTQYTVGIYDNPPICFRDDHGNFTGIAIDFLKAIAEEENWQLNFVEKSFENLLSDLNSHKIDILPGIAMSYERLQRYDFNREKIIENWGIFFRSPDVALTTIFDLEGLRIAAVEGDIHKEAVTKLLLKYGIDATLVVADDYVGALELVEDGLADVAVVNRVFSLLVAPEYEPVSSLIIFNPIKLQYAFPKGQHSILLHTLDRHLLEQKQDSDSAYHRALNYWLKQKQEFTFPTWAKSVIILLILLAVTFWFFNKTLRKEVKERTRELERSTLEAESANKAKSYFLANMSHEIRNPMNIILGNSELMLEESIDPALRESLLQINQSGQRLVQFIEAILNYSSMDTDGIELTEDPINIRELAQEAAAATEELISRERVRLRLNIDSNVEEHYLGDRHLVQQIFINLLSNAQKFTRQGQIEINLKQTAKPDSQEVLLQLQVSDTGIGMDREALDKIFLPFSQHDESPTRKYEGIGLGLCIVQKIVDAMQGNITVKSELEKGSQFTVIIPLKPAMALEHSS